MSSLSEGLLPPVLPIVLYNGSKRWRAAEELAPLLHEAPAELQQFRPSLRFLLIDEGEYHHDEPAGDHNLVAMLFRLENCRDLHEMERLLSILFDELRAPEQDSLRRAFVAWLDNVKLLDSAIAANDLWEKPGMLKEFLEERDHRLQLEARLEGRVEGRQQGESTLLHRQLKKRFGELPQSVVTLLQTAQTGQLESWAEQLLDATSLDEMFDCRAERALD